MKKILIITITIGVLLISSSPIYAYSTNMNASVVIGQPDFVSGSANQGGSTPTANSLNLPNGNVATDGTHMAVADQSNNRVLIWNHIPTVNNTPADVVLGQPDFVSSTANNGGLGASSLSGVSGVAIDGGKLIASDTGNKRVLIWNTIPTRNQTPADVVVGKPDFVSNTSVAFNATNLASPGYIFVYQNKLFITEPSSRSVRIWNTIPTTNGVAADVVIGQTSFGASAFGGLDASHFGTSASSASPRGIAAYQGKLAIFDYINNRVLIYNQIPTSNGAAADVVVGQTDFTSSTSSISCSTFFLPAGGVTITSSGRLMVSDARVLIWNTLPTSNGATADLVIGQPDCSTRNANTTINGVSTTRGVVEINNQLIVTDAGNHRILIYNNVQTTPSINISSPLTPLDGSKYRLTGNVFLNKNADSYALQKLSFDVNGTDNGGVAVSGGRDDGNGNTIYDFNYDFDPTVGGGSKNNLTIKILATTYNNDTNTLFYFLPFNFKSFNVSSTKSQNFTFSVNKDQLQRIKDNLDHFEVWYKPNTTTGKWQIYISNIPDTQIDQNGLVSYNKTTNNIRFIGSYIFKVVAVDNWGNKEDSNLLYIAGTGPVTKTSYASFAKSFVTPPTIIASARPVPTQTTNTSPVPIPLPTIETINSSNTGLNEEGVLKIVFIVSSVLAILLLIILLSRRRKSEETN